MKAQFIVTIEGSWLEGDKRVTHTDVQRELRDALKERFEFLAKRTSVKRYKPDAAASQGVERKGAE